jgi:hypothetical protein
VSLGIGSCIERRAAGVPSGSLRTPAARRIPEGGRHEHVLGPAREEDNAQAGGMFFNLNGTGPLRVQSVGRSVGRSGLCRVSSGRRIALSGVGLLPPVLVATSLARYLECRATLSTSLRHSHQHQLAQNRILNLLTPDYRSKA